MCAEIATYRVQMCESFTLDQGAAITDYLSQLGISHLYSSPVLQAAKGSTHAYDVLDHTRVNHELGEEGAFERLSEALAQHGLSNVLEDGIRQCGKADYTACSAGGFKKTAVYKRQLSALTVSVATCQIPTEWPIILRDVIVAQVAVARLQDHCKGDEY